MSHQQSPSRAPESASWVDEARAALLTGWGERLKEALSFRPRELVALTVVVLAIVLGAGVAFVRALPRGAAASPPVQALPSEAASPSPVPPVVVYVAGAVVRPGVYELAAGSRVVDALRAAGGLAPSADPSTLNLAQRLADGERIYVPRRGETPPPAQGGSGGGSPQGSSSIGGKVNINAATVAELDAQLPGVGPVLAQRIVDYRTAHGPFRDVRDLLKVEGIGQKKFDSLKDYVTV